MREVNYVFIANDYLRHLEKEFAEGISNCLSSNWTSDYSVVKHKRKAVNVTFFIYRRSHIIMSHGVADKNYLLRADAQGGLEINKYNYVCVPGMWQKRKLLNTPGVELQENQIKIVGWPRLDALLDAQEVYNKEKKSSEKGLNVLWAPTHGGGQKDKIYLSSYPGLLQYEDKLRELFLYERALHPAIEKSGSSTFEKLLAADVVISDRGTLVYEAWALGKPVIFPDWLIREGNLTKDPGSAETYIFEKSIGLHANSFEEMVEMIKQGPVIGNDVKEFLQDYLEPSSYGKSYQLIADVVEEVWDKGNLSVKAKAPKS